MSNAVGPVGFLKHESDTQTHMKPMAGRGRPPGAPGDSSRDFVPSLQVSIKLRMTETSTAAV